MRLFGFLTGFFLIAVALILFVSSDDTPIDTKSSVTQPLAQPENVDSLNRQSEKLEIVESDHTKKQPNGKTEFPERGVLPIAEPTQDILSGSTKSFQAISTAITTQAEQENEADPDNRPDRKPKTNQTASIQTQNKTTTASKSLEQISHWQPFWGPFNTPGSAENFAKAVVQKTGLDIRVKKTKPGRYMISYSYSSERERQGAALLIEQRTGLRIELN